MEHRVIIDGKRDPRLGKARRCPFCNSSFLQFQPGPDSKTWKTPSWRVICVACSALGPTAGSRKLAVRQWNGKKLFGTPLRCEEKAD